MEHIIIMCKKENPAEQVIVSGVTNCEYSYGCLVTLSTKTGTNHSFETDIWDLYDLYPQKGWQDTSPIPEGIECLLAPIAQKGCEPVDIEDAEGKLACRALCDPKTRELHFTYTAETKASSLASDIKGFTAMRNGRTAPVIQKSDGKWYLAANIPDPNTKWQCSIALLRQRPSEGEEWSDTLYLTLPGDQRPQASAGETMETFISRKVRELLSVWLQTPDGVQANAESCWDFNWGDIFHYLPIEFGGVRLGTGVDGDVTIAEAVGFSVDQDEHLAPDAVDVKILKPDRRISAAEGYIDFQYGTLVIKDAGGLGSLDGMLASGPYGEFSIVSDADGGYEIRVLCGEPAKRYP